MRTTSLSLSLSLCTRVCVSLLPPTSFQCIYYFEREGRSQKTRKEKEKKILKEEIDARERDDWWCKIRCWK